MLTSGHQDTHIWTHKFTYTTSKTKTEIQGYPYLNRESKASLYQGVRGKGGMKGQKEGGREGRRKDYRGQHF